MDMNNNWQKLSEEMVYNGRRKINKVTYQLPCGKPDDYEILMLGSSVCVFALTSENKIVIAKQFRPGPDVVLLELPGGKVDEGEDVKTAVVRELLEETGYRGNFIFLGKSFSAAYENRIKYHFLATDCKKVSEPLNDENEPIEPVLLSMDDFMVQLHNGELTDSETAYRALEYLNKNDQE